MVKSVGRHSPVSVTQFRSECASRIVFLMEMTSGEEISGIAVPDMTPDELTSNVADSELRNNALLLAFAGAELAGLSSLVVYYDDFFSREERSFFIGVLFVHPDYRRQGIGARLLNGSTRVAQQEGFSRLFAEVYAKNQPMLRLLGRQEWRVKSTIFQLEQSGDDWLARVREAVDGAVDLSFRSEISLEATRVDLHPPDMGDKGDVSISRAREDEISELAQLGYSRNALAGASKGLALIARHSGRVVGACTSLDGCIDHIRSLEEDDLRERLLSKMISALPPRMQGVSVMVDDLDFATSVASWGLEPTSVTLEVKGSLVQEGASLLEEFSITPSDVRFVLVKELE